MDDKELQLKELELKLKEKELELLSNDISFREARLSQNLDGSLSKQENLRRAVEVGSNSYSKFDTNCGEEVRQTLRSLVLTAATKLKDEILI